MGLAFRVRIEMVSDIGRFQDIGWFQDIGYGFFVIDYTKIASSKPGKNRRGYGKGIEGCKERCSIRTTGK
jgi:hypothetical protein